MLKNNEKYKNIEIHKLNFSVRLKNVARRNGLYSLYDLIASYNEGSFRLMRNVGKTTIQELENYDFSNILNQLEGLAQLNDLNNMGDTEDNIDINYDEILSTKYLESKLEKYIYDGVYTTYFHEHDIYTMRNILNLSIDIMKRWKGFGQKKIQIVLTFQKRILLGEECYLINGQVKARNQIVPSREIDPYMFKLLKSEYGLKSAWLCDWYGVTRQRVDQKIKKSNSVSSAKWDGFDYTKEEEDILINMLKNKKYIYSNENEYYYFLKNDKGNYAILIVNNVGIRCIFEEQIHDSLTKYILENRLNILDFKEIEILEQGNEISILKTNYFVPNKQKMWLFNDFAKKRRMDKNEYSVFLTGKPYITDFTVTDDKIYDFFEKHINDDGKVYISSDPSNQWIRSYAFRKGYRLSEFIEFYGYQSAIADDLLTPEGAKKRHLEMIKKYVIHDNVVFVPTFCEFYRILNSYSSRKKMTINEYVNELGYQRSLTPVGYLDIEFNDYEIIDSNESDMDIYKSDGSTLQKIFAKNPLLGNYIFTDKNMQIIHNKAKILIDRIVANRENELNLEQKMYITMSVINYAKKWDTNLGAFSNYIIKQYGYRSEDRVYSKIMKIIYDALHENKRWIFSSNGSIQYKSTIMIHAMGSVRTWIQLCDFLSDFYQNNLGCHYIENDPYILNLVMHIRSLFSNKESSLETETDLEIQIGTKPYKFQEGIRKLVTYRPNCASKVFERMIKRIHCYMNSNVLPTTKYEDYLVDLWFKAKTENFKNKSSNVVLTRKNRVALDYSSIKLYYRFYDDVCIEIPDIRLNENSSEPCYIEIYSQDELVYKKSLMCYGNELGQTISGFTYSLKDYFSFIDNYFISPRIVIKRGEIEIYDSGQKLKRRALFFQGDKEKDISSLVVGDYILVSHNSVNISGINVEKSIIKCSNSIEFSLINLHADYSLQIDNTIVSFDHKIKEKIHINLPNYIKGVKYVENGIEYNICKADGNISIVIDEKDVEQKYIILLNDKQISFSDLKCNTLNNSKIYIVSNQFISNKNRIQIIDFSCNKLVADRLFLYAPSFSFKFNSQYYFTDNEINNCCLEYSIDGTDYEIVNNECSSIISSEYLNGELIFDIPIVKLIDHEGYKWKKRRYFIDEIDRGLYLQLSSTTGVDGKIFIGNIEVQQDVNGLYNIGNTLHSLINTKNEVLKLILINNQNQKHEYNIGKIIFKEQFLTDPKLEYDDGKLIWDCGFGFIGNIAKTTYIKIFDKSGIDIFEKEINLNENIICESINLSDGKYQYIIYRENDDMFSLDVDILAEGNFISGNYDKIRFDNCKITISQVLFDNPLITGVVNIMPTYIDNIQYSEELSKEEGSEGICPTYKGTMYFINPEGKRHDYAFQDEYRSETDIREKINPVKIIYINDSVLLVTTEEDEGLMFRYYFDRKTGKKIYHITDHKQTVFEKNNYDVVDLLRYRKEKL